MNNINDKIEAFLDYNGEDTIRSRGFVGRETVKGKVYLLMSDNLLKKSWINR